MESEDSGGGGGDTSMYQVLHAQDSYPKLICKYDEPSLSIPFTELPGEYAAYVGRTSDGLIALSNYRLLLQQRDATHYIPLGVIEFIECREIFFLYILCKDTKSYKCTFATNEHSGEWQKRINKALTLPERLENVFSFRFYMWTMEVSKDLHSSLLVNLEHDGPAAYAARADKMFSDEVHRLGFDLGSAWRISKANIDFQLCPTYPRKLVVPASINDNILESVARFRSAKRIPAVVWRHPNGAVVARCSQPEVGWLGWRSSEDEDLVKAIAEACAFDSPSGGINNGASLVSVRSNEKDATTPTSDIPSLCDLPEAKAQTDIKKVLIVDARSYATAVANRARGGGCECPEYYPACEIQFMNLANIHTIRKSHHALRQLVGSPADTPNWLSVLESTRWLAHISGLIKAAVTVTHAIVDEARPVLVHCSDGWDRTPQITALAQILMDPYYRTMQGFQVLVEREWIEFGHKFSDRCGVGKSCEDINERCPVFLQWLDCLHQLLRQFPTAFQYNEAYLVKLGQHVYSNMFGTFICNSSQERVQAETGERTYSVWAFLRINRYRYINYLYSHSYQVLKPSYHTKDLLLWTNMYVPEMMESSEEMYSSNHIPVPEEEDLVTEAVKATAKLARLVGNEDFDMEENEVMELEQHDMPLSNNNLMEPVESLGKEGRHGTMEVPQQRAFTLEKLAEFIRISSHLKAFSCDMDPSMEEEEAPSGGELVKTKSCDDLLGASPPPHNTVRRSSDPNIRDSCPNMAMLNSALGADLATVEGDGMEDSSAEANGLTNDESESLTLCDQSLATSETQELVDNCGITNGVMDEEKEIKPDSIPNGVGMVDKGVNPVPKYVPCQELEVKKVTCEPKSVNNGHIPHDLRERSIEGSTDTLVAEVGVVASEESAGKESTSLVSGKPEDESTKPLLNGKCFPFLNNHNALEESEQYATPNGTCARKSNRKAQGTSSNNENGQEEVKDSKKSMNGFSNLSAVMSSVSSSGCSICIQSKKLLDETSNGIESWRSPPGLESTSSNGARVTTGPGSRVSLYSTPMHSRTPSSCIPSTPCEDRFGTASDSRSSSHTQDGLHNITDEITKRLHSIRIQYKAEVEALRRDLQATRQALCNQVLHNRCHQHHDNNTEDQVSLPESVGSGSGGSVGQESGVSDTSWEAVEEGEARPTLWVPDHAVDHCTGCNTQFWIGRRKHHCRSCGKIFCAECSEHSVPIPREQLYQPVRVCGMCYTSLAPHELIKAKILTAASN
ncbi:phosphatidylinositol-3,5-bisphosphate 3-phosphatase MTMR3 isoform X2 [Oratosquilla oratoria]